MKVPKIISDNKKMWEEEKQKNISKCGGNCGGTYESKKWVNDEKEDIDKSGNGSGGDKFDGVWHMMCNKGCGWNKKHTAIFHGK